MESINQYDDLLFRYLANEVNAQEKKFVEDWIEATKQNRQHFEELKNVWQLSSLKQSLDYVLDEMNLHEKWNDARQAIADKDTAEFNHYQGEYNKEDRPVRKPKVYRLVVQAGIAASVVLLIGFGWKLFIQHKPESAAVKDAGKQSVESRVVVRHEVNTTGRQKRIQLPDGSLIVLADKSEITYREPFKARRDIELIGKAYFKVSKDATSPFTVVSEDVFTTALGTEFTVTAFKKDKTITVRLYEGKVVVKASSRLTNNTYLLPGQEYIYDKQPSTKLKRFKLKEPAAPEQILVEERFRDHPAIPEDDAGSWYMFNNQQLGEVLEQFAMLYNVRIVYGKNDVKNIYFTGKYNRLEPLETILKRIGTVNNLKIEKKDSAFIISKVRIK